MLDNDYSFLQFWDTRNYRIRWRYRRFSKRTFRSCTRVCVCVCVCVCVSWIACARVCITCVMHVDLKVQEGMKVKIRMKHTRMPRPRRMPASYSCTPHTQACTHARMPRTLYYARQAWLACYACVCSVRDASAIRAWLSCVRVVWAWVVCRYAW